MMTMKFLLAAIIGIAMTSAVHGCFPVVYTNSSSFTHGSNGKAILFDAAFTCDGTLDQLTYYIDTYTGTLGEYFSVWKPLGNNRYEMMGRVAISGNPTSSSGAEEYTQVLTGTDRLAVETDWIIGLFKSSSSEDSCVPYASDSGSLGTTPYQSSDLVAFSEQSIYDLQVNDVWNYAFDANEVRMPSIKPDVV